MQVTTTISYKIKWPVDLLPKGVNFARGTPEVGDRVLKRVGAKIVSGLKKSIMESRGIRGGKLLELKEKTWKKKERQGYKYPKLPLYGTGILYNAIKYYKTGDGLAKVSIVKRGKPNRREVAKWQQTGEYTTPPRPRVFFGINPTMRKDINDLIAREFKAMMRRSKVIQQGIARASKAAAALD